MENNKKLERDTQHKVIGGVCAGLASYFGLDVSLVRVLFALLFLFASAGFWVYLVLWAVMPSASRVQIENDGQNVADLTETNPSNPGSKGSLVAGLILIGVGAIGLLHRFVPEFNWQTIWPIALIIIGILLLFPSKSQKS